MVKEAEDNTELDAVRAAEERKFGKLEIRFFKIVKTPKYLIRQVDQGRQEQIKIRREREAKAIEDEKVYSKKFLQDAKEGVARENAEAEHRRRIAEDNNVHLMSQIELKGSDLLKETGRVSCQQTYGKNREAHQGKIGKAGWKSPNEFSSFKHQVVFLKFLKLLECCKGTYYKVPRILAAVFRLPPYILLSCRLVLFCSVTLLHTTLKLRRDCCHESF